MDSFWSKTAKLNCGSLGTSASSASMDDEPTVYVGILTGNAFCNIKSGYALPLLLCYNMFKALSVV